VYGHQGHCAGRRRSPLDSVTISATVVAYTRALAVWFSDFNSHIVLRMDAINVVAHRIVERALVAVRPPEVAAPGFQSFDAGRAVLGVAQAAAPAPLLPACVVPGNHGALVVLVRVHAIQATPAWRALSLLGHMAADAAMLRSASRCCQSRINPASLASCSKKARDGNRPRLPGPVV
jgi:hypothetical protein